jgi:hypothetical protein
VISATGRWGVHITDDDHTLLGATAAAPHFLHDYCATLGTAPTAMVEHYVRGYEVSDWHRARRMGRETAYPWVPTLLAHVFGPSEAERLLTEPSNEGTG